MTDDTTAEKQKFFKDKNGKVVLWQIPNMPLYGWIIFKIISMVITQKHLKSGFEHLSMAFLFIWAYLETTQGVNYFRKLLGILVLASIIVSFFR